MTPPIRIVITGTESTGKTWLTEQLASHFQAPWSAEYARQFWDEHGGISAPDLDDIGRGQIANEESAAAKAQRLVFHDTDLVTCVVWNDLLFPQACPDWVRVEARRRARQVALYLLCSADVPYVPDPQRCFPEPDDRQRAAVLWRSTLAADDVPFVTIAGDWPERLRQAIAEVQRRLPGGQA